MGRAWLCRYVPSVVRVGPNVKETLHDVSLDTLAKRRQVDSLDSSLSYDAAKMAVLNEASIVCTTLSCATPHPNPNPNPNLDPNPNPNLPPGALNTELAAEARRSVAANKAVEETRAQLQALQRKRALTLTRTPARTRTRTLTAHKVLASQAADDDAAAGAALTAAVEHGEA